MGWPLVYIIRHPNHYQLISLTNYAACYRVRTSRKASKIAA
ncbi:hypothetical protein AWB69_01413 [Caballeronia udeis]|uniref:Uncharacterized protein n=1 Tax=Caballeronia udeis TaxID=1232866 RepID=A0A158FPJ2_9BURK|nr:hypothetical protein AWB69_01413 [Caballeronia udeis]